MSATEWGNFHYAKRVQNFKGKKIFSTDEVTSVNYIIKSIILLKKLQVFSIIAWFDIIPKLWFLLILFELQLRIGFLSFFFNRNFNKIMFYIFFLIYNKISFICTCNEKFTWSVNTTYLVAVLLIIQYFTSDHLSYSYFFP